MSESLLEVRGLWRGFASGPRRIEVLRGLDLDLPPGQALAVVGDSGVGKSTLLHLLGGLDRPEAGHVRFRGRDLFAGDEAFLARYRNRHVGFVFQLHHLLPEFTALENVALPFRIGRRAEDPRPRARALLERLGLGQRLHHRPGALSGGEQQRVAIARALVTEPDVVLADEPTGNLDPSTGTEVFRMLRNLQREYGFALVLATHSERLARGCDRILRLEEGRLRPLDEREIAEYFQGASPGGQENHGHHG